jgi:C1A family cysteine protease
MVIIDDEEPAEEMPVNPDNFSRRGLGWKQDRPESLWHPPDRSARVKLGTSLPPTAASVRKFVTSILDQGPLGSCTCNAVAQALHVSAVAQGHDNPPYASRLFAYYLARAYDHDTASDNGTYLRNVFMALVKFGFPPESAWPYSSDQGANARFRLKPSAEAFREAYDQRHPTEYLRIDSQGAERITDIKRAIAAGDAVVFGTAVSEDFCSNNLGQGPLAPLPPPLKQTIAGNHALCIAEYDHDSFGIVNSWGEGFGAKGWCTFSADYLAWERSNDFWIVRLAPPFSAERDIDNDDVGVMTEKNR